MGNENATAEGEKFRAIYSGVIVDNADPLKLGRVRVRIQGLIEKSSWALPIGNPGSGAKKRGGIFVPPSGADVAIFFHAGDVDQPRYLGGNYGTGEVPGFLGGYDGEDVDPKDAALVPGWEGERYVVQVDERAGKERLFIRDKTTGDELLLDGAKGAIQLKATTLVNIVSDGVVNIEAPVLTLNGRPVAVGADPI